MGDKKRMDIKSNKVTLYTSQSNEVLDILTNDKIYYPKMEYIKKKYQETSDSFLTAYKWFKEHASKIVPIYKFSDSAIWSFTDKKYTMKHPDSNIIKFTAPLDKVIFFKMSDWNKILNYRFISTNEEEEEKFLNKINRLGINYEGDAFTTPYYPMIRKEIILSWNNLFRFDSYIKEGNIPSFSDIQVATWILEENWILNII